MASLREIAGSLARIRRRYGLKWPVSSSLITSVRPLPISRTSTEVIKVEEPIPRLATPQDLAEAIIETRDLIKEQEAEGEIVSYDLILSESMREKEFRHPIFRDRMTPLVTATIYNDGPSTGYFKINHPNFDPITLKSTESVSIDLAKSKKRMDRVFYYTGAGGSATARLVGKF